MGMRRVSFWGPRHAGMEGPQTRRHDGAQRRKILIMGPSAARYRGPSAAVGPQRARECGLRGCMGPNRASKHTSRPHQQAYKQTAPASIQASVPTSIQADRAAMLMSRGSRFTHGMGPRGHGGPARRMRAAACAGMARLRGECGLSRCMGPNRASKHTSKPCQQAYKQTVPASIQADRASKHTS